jgi:arylformamidase
MAAAGSRVVLPGLPSLPGTGLIGHMQISRQLGDPAYAGTAPVDAWLARLFAPAQPSV